MKPAALVASLCAFLSPGLALACPAAREACATGGCSGLGGYMAALGVGLLVGIGSVGLEGFFRRK